MNNHDVAQFLSNLMIVFVIVIFIRILASWLPRRPVTGPFKTILDFADQTADPYLNIFRSFIKPIGSGPMSIDLSPMVAVIVLTVFGGIIIGAVDNL